MIHLLFLQMNLSCLNSSKPLAMKATLLYDVSVSEGYLWKRGDQDTSVFLSGIMNV